MALIDGSIKKHLKAQIGDCNRELLELTNQLEEVHLSLNIVNKIKTCYDAVEEGNSCISAGRCGQKICFRKLQKYDYNLTGGPLVVAASPPLSPW